MTVIRKGLISADGTHVPEGSADETPGQGQSYADLPSLPGADMSEELGMPQGSNPIYGGIGFGAASLFGPTAAQQQQEQQQSLQDHLDQNPPFDFIDDPAAQEAIMPRSPEVPPHFDNQNEFSRTKLGKGLRLLSMIAQGAAAGAGAPDVGSGFRYAQQSAANLQRLQMERDNQRQMQQFRQLQMEGMAQQQANFPQQQAGIAAERQKRMQLMDQQIEKGKRRPNDTFEGAYQGQDGYLHGRYRTPEGERYEAKSDERFYQKPEAKPRPILGYGHGSNSGNIYLINPDTGHSQLVVKGHPGAPQNKRATPAQFNQLDNWKDEEWQKTVRDIRYTPRERKRRLQEVQNHFERALSSFGGDVIHHEVSDEEASDSTSMMQQRKDAAQKRTMQGLDAGNEEQGPISYQFWQSYNGHNYGRNSESEPWKRID